VHNRLKEFEIPRCPFANLPDRRPSSFGQGITKEKMGACTWLNPAIVAEIEFAEWTPEQLRHAAFSGFRSDKKARNVVKET
jgi:bifunctional non-homologous end joining protein LigD